MKKTILIFSIILLVVSCKTIKEKGPKIVEADIAITNVNIINVEDGSVLENRTLLIRGNKITNITFFDESFKFSDSTKTIDGTGKFLIPGLWDMHMHAMQEETMVNTRGRDYETLLPLFLANGVTGIRDMWGRLDIAEKAHNAILLEAIIGPPRKYVAGAIVNGPSPYPHLTAATPERGVAIVDSLHKAGATFIKVYFQLSKETYDAINKRSKELGIYVAGHTPFDLSVGYISDAGQRSIEHMTGIVQACSSKEDSLIKVFQDIQKSRDMRRIIDSAINIIPNEALANQDDEVMQTLFQKLIENQTWQVPTLISLYGKAYMKELQSKGDSRTKYYQEPPRWLGPGPFGFPMSDEQWEALQNQYQREKELVGLMAKAGVPIMAGTDFGTPYVFPGFSIHDELQLFVEAGMTPLQALQTATINPAKFLERTNELGTVEVAKLADILILEANPLEDIRNTKKIYNVIADGRIYSREDIDTILKDTEIIVNKSLGKADE